VGGNWPDRAKQGFSILDLRFWIEEAAMNKAELKDRTKQFALRIIKVVEALPNTTAGRTVGNQLVRSGTSVGANYRSACRARSTAEFVAKLGVVVEESDESAYWLELIAESKMLKQQLLQPLLQEANELTAIMVASRRSALRKIANRKSKIKNLK
jgi:four helix bundle protein